MILDLWPPELGQNTLLLFAVTQLVAMCYGCRRRRIHLPTLQTANTELESCISLAQNPSVVPHHLQGQWQLLGVIHKAFTIRSCLPISLASSPALPATGLPAQPQQCPATPAFPRELLFILQNPAQMLSPQERLPRSIWMERTSCSLFSFGEHPEIPL